MTGRLELLVKIIRPVALIRQIKKLAERLLFV